MRYLDEFQDPELAKRLLDDIHATAKNPWAMMEVCGGQTHSIIRHGLDQGFEQIEVTQEAEASWMALLRSGLQPGVIGSAECTPGYYNNEGMPAEAGNGWFLGYPMGAAAYFEYLDGWLRSGDFEGLEFR